MASETELLRLALLAYEAASEPEMWPRFLELANDAVSSDAIVLQVHHLDSHRSEILSGFGINSPMTRSYNEHYSKLNVWRDGGHARYAAGAVNLDQEQCPRSVLERSEFYNDYLRRIGVAHSMGLVIARHQNLAPTLTHLRGHQKGGFGEPERKIAMFLLPHLARAWSIYQRLDLLAAGEAVMDRLPLGVVFMAADGTAIYWNSAAAEMFQANDGLTLREGALCAIDLSANTQLRSIIGAALSPCGTRAPLAVSISRRCSRREYQIVAAPLRSGFRQFVGTPAPLAVVLITDPERKKPTCAELLIQIYELTPKEALLSCKLSEGKLVKQAAEELSITYETARTHLRRIFSKTGTTRQAELLLLMNQLPGDELKKNKNG